jgi:hypothetical protein
VTLSPEDAFDRDNLFGDGHVDPLDAIHNRSVGVSGRRN